MTYILDKNLEQHMSVGQRSDNKLALACLQLSMDSHKKSYLYLFEKIFIVILFTVSLQNM